MKKMKKCCGTCKWWGVGVDRRGKFYLDCGCPVPEWCGQWLLKTVEWMESAEGANCNCWEAWKIEP